MMVEGGEMEKKKVVLIARFRDKRVSYIYDRPTKKRKKKRMCYTLCKGLDYI
jgi:hypothetical protein